mmetsp:Transcript_1320/g.3820  ORF Transcript_1320/g.3820 Transcript_1320/m.3820 type:complete len:471 (+) Transcript_1320:480-1892(+)
MTPSSAVGATGGAPPAEGRTGARYRLSRSEEKTTLTEDIAMAAPAAQAGSVAPMIGKVAPAAAGTRTRLYTKAHPKFIQMRLWMARETSMAASTPVIWAPISTMLAASMAMSVPLPMARPRSAWARAGASLMPSPTMATICPASCSVFTWRALLPGMTSAITNSSERPSFSATELAVVLLSPVTIHVEMPMELSLLRSARLSGRGASAMPKTPATWRSIATRTAVLAWASSEPVAACTSAVMPLTFISSIHSLVPTRTCRPSTLQCRPFPEVASNSVGVPRNMSSSLPAVPPLLFIMVRWAYTTRARPRGCSLLVSAAPVSRTISGRASFVPSLTASVTCGFPSVRVPVLSKIMAVTFLACSMASPSLMRTPCLAATPVPTMMAVGTARPMAQGQATTIVAIPMLRAKASGVRSLIHCGGTTPVAAATSHPLNTDTEMATIVGTNTRLIPSASAWMGGLEAWASSIILTI